MNPLHTLVARALLSLVFVAGYGVIVIVALKAGDFSPAADGQWRRVSWDAVRAALVL